MLTTLIFQEVTVMKLPFFLILSLLMASCSWLSDDSPNEMTLKEEYNEYLTENGYMKDVTNVKVNEIKNLECKTESKKGDDQRIYMCQADLVLSDGNSVHDRLLATYFTGRAGNATLDPNFSDFLVELRKHAEAEQSRKDMELSLAQEKADEARRAKEIQEARAAEEANFRANQADVLHSDINEHPEFESQEQPQDDAQQSQNNSQEQPTESNQEQSQENNQEQNQNEGNEQR